MRPFRATIYLLFFATALAACGGRTYTHGEVTATSVISRAEAQSSGPVTVRSSVPGAAETADIFGLPLYEQGVQPIWIEVHNGGAHSLRYAPVGTDRNYFSPLEVAWKHRGPFNDESRMQMNKRFHDLAMPRQIEAGQTASGFVFSNYRQGVKAFNIDLFGNNTSYDFTFLVEVPGFTADYADIDFKRVYDGQELVNMGETQFRKEVTEFPCCTLDADGQPGEFPVNVVLIGEGIDLLKSLLRGNWSETSKHDAEQVTPAFLFSRKQDAIFQYHGTVNNGYYEIRLWLAPMQIDGNLVWMGALRHVIENAWSVTKLDPDIDLARNFMLQNMWYSQALLRFGWARGQKVLPDESFWRGGFENPYFTDGYRGVYWLSAEPVSYLESEQLGWDVLHNE
jgi:hypothetical protein